jgi:DNA-binding transcriptional LysR family regulator
MKNSGIDWNDLKYFLATARHGGLSGAAAALNSSASTVSRHVAALEQSLGATLFLRHQTGYMLTDDGSELYARTEQVEQAIMATERSAAQAAQRQITGQVRLATTEMLAQHLIAPHLAQFHARHPQLQLEVHVAMTRANLTRREADLALRLVAPQEDEGASDYVASRIGMLHYGLYAAAGTLDPAPDRAQADAWRSLAHVGWDEASSGLPTAKWLASAFAGKSARFCCNSMQTQYAAVRAGLGIGLLPCFVAARDALLQRIPVSMALPANELWLVYHRDLKASQRVIALRDFIRELAAAHLQDAG